MTHATNTRTRSMSWTIIAVAAVMVGCDGPAGRPATNPEPGVESAFRRAIELDEDRALGYRGQAVSSVHPVWPDVPSV